MGIDFMLFLGGGLIIAGATLGGLKLWGPKSLRLPHRHIISGLTVIGVVLIMTYLVEAASQLLLNNSLPTTEQVDIGTGLVLLTGAAMLVIGVVFAILKQWWSKSLRLPEERIISFLIVMGVLMIFAYFAYALSSVQIGSF